MSAHRHNEGHVSALRLWLKPSAVWLALLLLLGLTVGSAYVPLGAFNGVINYGIAATKAALVLIFFMHLDRSRALIRLTALTGLFWLMFLFSLAFGDYLTRNWNGGSTALQSIESGSPPLPRLPLDPRFGRGD